MWAIVQNRNGLVTIPSLDRVVWATEVTREECVHVFQSYIESRRWEYSCPRLLVARQ